MFLCKSTTQVNIDASYSDGGYITTAANKKIRSVSKIFLKLSC